VGAPSHHDPRELCPFFPSVIRSCHGKFFDMGWKQGGKVVRGNFGRRGRWTQIYDYGAPRGPRRRWLSWLNYAWLWIGAIGVGGAYGAGAFDGLHLLSTPADAAEGIRANFGYCHSGGGYNCVVDGDTIWLQGQKIRVADIDAPETHPARCASEQALGDQATQRLRQLLNGGVVTLRPIDRDVDRYGRKLRIVLVNGISVGDTLVGEGLARWYAGGRRPWC
jgi:micrococcal nuclease